VKFMKKLRMAASVRHVSLASGYWFLYVSTLESEMEKTGAKIWVRDGHRKVFDSLNFTCLSWL